MKWIEANPLPAECENCMQQSCYACDIAGVRWSLPEREELLLRRKMLVKSIARAQKQIDEIDEELAQMDSIPLRYRNS